MKGESRQQKSTAAINRANFENARNILFGTDIIPGTNREHWTTAGMKPKNYPKADFTLGKYQFRILNFMISLKTGDEYIPFFSITGNTLNFYIPDMQNSSDFKMDFFNSMRDEMKMFIDKDSGKALATVEFEKGFLEYIPKIFADSENDTSLTGFKRLHGKKLILESFWHTSDLRYLTGAIDWLMHVLTGPDPRTFNSPYNYSSTIMDKYKEESEPRSYFVYERHKENFILKRTQENLDVDKLIFFLAKPETTDASQYVKDVSEFLRNYQYEEQFSDKEEEDKKQLENYKMDNKRLNARREARKQKNFAQNFAKFVSSLDNGLKDEAEKSGFTFKKFNKALARLKQYQEHEFLGCSVCGNETKLRCSETKKLYCSVECQMVATKLK